MTKKRKSKRMTLHKKHKIEKKVREHHRKVRKAAKRKLRSTGGTGVVKLKKKDPGIPNSYPFKRQLMEELERKRAEAKERKSQAAKLKKERSRCTEIKTLAEDARKRTADFEMEHVSDDDHQAKKILDEGIAREGSRKAFMKDFQRVVECADVILEVLDARDPLGCRCYDAERALHAYSGGRKRIVLVLNKVDLVPKDVTNKWLAYLRNEYPTVAFRASIQSGGAQGRLSQTNMTSLAASTVGTSGCLGAANLLSLLKNYSRSRNLKTSICVGVVGFPNVGKSSLINSLKRARVVSVGSTPGVTRSLKQIHLDKNLRLIDCPGIIFSSRDAEALVLRNCIRIGQMEDVITPVETILKRVGAEPLMVAYSLPQFASVAEFLALVAKLRGRFKKGGAFDLEAAAKIVLTDWNSGQIPFYTLPPKGPRGAHISAKVVSEWSKEFDVDTILQKEEVELRSLGEVDAQSRARFICVQSSEITGPVKNEANGASEQVGYTEAMDVDKSSNLSSDQPLKSQQDGLVQTYHVAIPDEKNRIKQSPGHNRMQG